ncbi:zinc-ribbon domain-containing protein [uncultured Enorma sp.]|uniref:zinc-ribbon domain-containing protein n=1 Tax=uncultured Enorma sp. TaxID=1714346 RepID=UPI00265DB6C8|nr:zinc-ribbon domain-containing protein [uncultured Enorma sp.]
MFCPYCGTQLPDGSAFCGNCGKPLSQQPAGNAAPAAQPAGMPPVPAPQPGNVPPASAPQPGNVPPATPPDFNQQTPFDAKPAKKPFQVTRGMTIGILAVAVVAVVAIVLAVTGVFGGGSGESSATAVADKLGGLYNDLLQSDFDSDAFESFGNGMLNLYPDEVVDGQLESMGYDSREDFSETLGQNYGYGMSYYSDDLSYMTIEIDVTLGDKLDGSRLYNVNTYLEQYGLEATDGYLLEATLTATLTEDYNGFSAGEQQSQETSTGMAAIEIDGRWYLYEGVY